MEVHLEDETRFLEGVERGIAAAERGQFIEQDEMDARVKQMLKTRCVSVGPRRRSSVYKRTGFE